MTKEEATAYWKQRSEHIHNWLEENEDVDCIGEYVEAIDMAIEALRADWISITESEPNTSDHVLVTYKWDEDDYETSELDYWVTKHEAENGNAQCKRLIDHVIAWRYMLAPYRGGDAE